VALTKGPDSTVLTAALLPCPLAEWGPWYTPQQAWFKTEEGNFLPNRWLKFADGCIAIPTSLAPTFVKQFHEGTQSGRTALETTLAQHFYVPKLSSIRKAVCERCTLCAKLTPDKGCECLLGRSVGRTPLENFLVDFAEMSRVQGRKYLLVCVCTFSEWVEALPTQTEKAQEVAR
jgi:hypothetical protein